MNYFYILELQKKFYFNSDMSLYEVISDEILNDEISMKQKDYSIQIEYLNKKKYYHICIYRLNAKIDETQLKENFPVIIDFFDCVIVLKDKKYLNIIIENHYESIDYTLSDLILEYPYPKVIYKPQLNQIKNIIYDLLNGLEMTNQKMLKYYDKLKGEIEYSYFPWIEKKKRVNSNLLNLNDCYYEINETRYQTKNTIDPGRYVGRFGVAYNMYELTTYDCTGIPIFQCESLANTIERNYSIHGGKGLTKQQSLFSALGESIERYSSRYFEYENNMIDKFSIIKNKFNVLEPQKLQLDEDFINEFNIDKNLEWFLGYDLTEKKEMYMPANSVYFPYNKENNLVIHSQSTTGIAAGYKIEEAILQGTLEVIERDAYSISHKAKLELKNIEYTGNNIITNRLISICHDLNLQTHLKLLSDSYNCYVVHCTLEGADFPLYTHGSGASLDIDTAINRAILEAFQMRTSQILYRNNISNEIDEENIYIQWGNGNKEYFYNFLKESSNDSIKSEVLEARNTGNIKTDIELIINSLKFEGYKVIVADISRAEAPLKCVRILIPGFQDIDNYNTRVTDRLKERLNCNSINKLPMFS